VSIVTIGCGLALMALGAIAFVTTQAPTALIPGYFGIPLCILGFIGVWNDKLRMHVMHAAVIITLVGFLVPACRVVISIPAAITSGGFRHADGSDATIGFVTQLVMAMICAGHVGLSVKSFIDARRRRKQAAATPTEQIPS
jgi:hypothetical protein